MTNDDAVRSKSRGVEHVVLVCVGLGDEGGHSRVTDIQPQSWWMPLGNPPRGLAGRLLFAVFHIGLFCPKRYQITRGGL